MKKRKFIVEDPMINHFPGVQTAVAPKKRRRWGLRRKVRHELPEGIFLDWFIGTQLSHISRFGIHFLAVNVSRPLSCLRTKA